MSREQTLSPTDFYTLSPVINERVTHFHPLNELKRPHKNSHSASCVFPYRAQAHQGRVCRLARVRNSARRKKGKPKQHTETKIFSRVINTCTHTPLTHYLELSNSPSHRAMTGARPVFPGITSPGVKGQLGSVKSGEVLRAPWRG